MSPQLLPALLLALCWVATATFADGDPPAAAGDSLPEFTVVDQRGVPSHAASFRGETLLLDFWASWCYPCRFTMLELDMLHEALGGRDDFRIVGVSIDKGIANRRKAERMASAVQYDIRFDSGSRPLAPQLGVESVPVLFLIDAEGQILQRWNGEPDFSTVRAAVLEHLDGEPEATDEP